MQNRTTPVTLSALDDTEAALIGAYPYEIDLSNCDVEPLHHIQVIQTFGCVLGVDTASFRITHASENAPSILGVSAESLLGTALDRLLDADEIKVLQEGLNKVGLGTINPMDVTREVDGKPVALHVNGHLTAEGLALCFEHVRPTSHARSNQSRLGRAIQRIQRITEFELLFEETVKVIRELSGFDRVMLYRFDADHNGEVVAESRRDDLTPFHGLRYPASDIPAQARALYLRNQVRLLANVQELPARLLTAEGLERNQHLDLSLVDARGLSPVHREYLSNMGVAATMSVAIILHGKLWGLFAMHHYTPRYLEIQDRSFLRFVGQVFSGHLALQEVKMYRERVLEVKVLRSRLADQVDASGSLLDGLAAGQATVLDIIVGTTGAAISLEGEFRLLGSTPDEDAVQALVAWIAERTDVEEDIFATDTLCTQFDGCAGIEEHGAGVLLVWLNRKRREYIAWFRPEIAREVLWGGDPAKLVVQTAAGGSRLSPRKSFARYVEKIQERSEPWTAADEDAALALRSHVKDVVLRRYQEVQKVNSDLTAAYKEMEAFSYTVSHDLRAPLRGIAGFASILLEDYGEALGEEGREMLETIGKSTERMNTFINELLQLSQVGMSAVAARQIDLGSLVHAKFEEVITANPLVPKSRSVELVIEPDLPYAYGDSRLLSIALDNLISNAIKYSLDTPRAVVTFGAEPNPEATSGVSFFVRDNGAGFEQRYAERVFEMFTRLTDDTRVEGSGVGLAIVQRVIRKHGGKIWARAAPGEGATFYFTLGVQPGEGR